MLKKIIEIMLGKKRQKSTKPWITFVGEYSGTRFMRDCKPRYDFDRAKYMPHQGSNEKSRRIGQGLA